MNWLASSCLRNVTGDAVSKATKAAAHCTANSSHRNNNGRGSAALLRHSDAVDAGDSQHSHRGECAVLGGNCPGPSCSRGLACGGDGNIHVSVGIVMGRSDGAFGATGTTRGALPLSPGERAATKGCRREAVVLSERVLQAEELDEAAVLRVQSPG